MNKNETKPDLIQKLIKAEEKDHMQAETIEHLRSRIREALYMQSQSPSITPYIRRLIPAGAFILLAAAVTVYWVLSPTSNLDIPQQTLISFLENNSNIQIIAVKDRTPILQKKVDEFSNENSKFSNFITEALINASHASSSVSTPLNITPVRMKVTAAENLEKIKILIRANIIKNFMEKYTFLKEDNHDQKNMSHSSIYWIYNIHLICV
jgi:hypothetical protein